MFFYISVCCAPVNAILLVYVFILYVNKINVCFMLFNLFYIFIASYDWYVLTNVYILQTLIV